MSLLLLFGAPPATTDRTGFGPFSRLGTTGVSQQLYGSFAGKVEAGGGPTVVDVTDTLSVSLTESVDSFVSSAVTDTLSASLTESVDSFVSSDVTDTLSVSLTESVDSFVSSALTDTLSVSLAESVESFVSSDVTDTLSVSLSEVADLFESEDKAVTDTWSVTVTDAGTVEATGEQQGEQPSGGYGAQNYYDAWQQRRRRKRDDDEDEDKPERVAQPATPPEPQPNADLELTRQLVAYWSGEADRAILTRRAQRALDYALRAETVLAMQLFERELAKQMEEEEIALMLFMLDD